MKLAIIVLCLGLLATVAQANNSTVNSLNQSVRAQTESMAEVSTQMALNEMEYIPARRRYSRWSKSWFNWATQNLEDTNNGVGRLSTYNHLSINYRLNEGTVSFRPVFFVSGAGNDYRGDPALSEFEMGDLYVQYSRYNLALLPGGIGLTGAFRFYLPTSELSKVRQTQGQVRAKFYFNKPWGAGWNTTFMIEPKYYFHKERGYIDDVFGNRFVKANKYTELWYYLEQSVLFNSTFGLSAQTGLKHSWFYDIESENIRNEIRDEWGTAFYFLVNMDGAMFKIGMQQSRSIRQPRRYKDSPDSYEFFNPEESEISVMTYVRL